MSDPVSVVCQELRNRGKRVLASQIEAHKGFYMGTEEGRNRISSMERAFQSPGMYIYGPTPGCMSIDLYAIHKAIRNDESYTTLVKRGRRYVEDTFPIRLIFQEIPLVSGSAFLIEKPLLRLLTYFQQVGRLGGTFDFADEIGVEPISCRRARRMLAFEEGRYIPGYPTRIRVPYDVFAEILRNFSTNPRLLRGISCVRRRKIPGPFAFGSEGTKLTHLWRSLGRFGCELNVYSTQKEVGVGFPEDVIPSEGNWQFEYDFRASVKLVGGKLVITIEGKRAEIEDLIWDAHGAFNKVMEKAVWLINPSVIYVGPPLDKVNDEIDHLHSLLEDLL